MSLRRNREWSLVFFTLLTQLAVGTFAIWALGAVLLPSPNPLQAGMFPLAVLGTVLCTLIVGALIAASHLGRFTSAAFSLSNLRSSWLSREALLTIGFGLIVVTAIKDSPSLEPHWHTSCILHNQHANRNSSVHGALASDGCQR
jgi:DMSO reductase anchor subunit